MRLVFSNHPYSRHSPPGVPAMHVRREARRHNPLLLRMKQWVTCSVVSRGANHSSQDSHLPASAAMRSRRPISLKSDHRCRIRFAVFDSSAHSSQGCCSLVHDTHVNFGVPGPIRKRSREWISGLLRDMSGPDFMVGMAGHPIWDLLDQGMASFPRGIRIPGGWPSCSPRRISCRISPPTRSP